MKSILGFTDNNVFHGWKLVLYLHLTKALNPDPNCRDGDVCLLL